MAINIKEVTALRRGNFSKITPERLDQVLNLENVYGKYNYTPVNIPRIYDSKIIDWFFEHSKKVSKLKPDIAHPTYGYSVFNSIDIELETDKINPDPIWDRNYYPNFDKDFPHFYQQMLDLLPLREIPRFTFWSSIRDVIPHRDHTIFLDMPNSFRIMLYDDNPRDTLYVYEDARDGAGPKVYIKKNTDTNTFIWNNLRVVHGSDYIPGHRKILLIINYFKPKLQKYKDIMDSSVQKYADQVLVSNLPLSQFTD